MLCTQKTPYLYAITVTLYDENGNKIDEKQTHFGMRKFHMDENSTPKGAFYLNNERIILRGTNEMGHLPLCVMRGDYEQLIDDILIAKVANLNFYRMTQRPVHDEIYTYFDSKAQNDMENVKLDLENMTLEEVIQSVIDQLPEDWKPTKEKAE